MPAALHRPAPKAPNGSLGRLDVTIIFAVAMFLQAKFPERLQPIAIVTLISVAIYITAWPTVF